MKNIVEGDDVPSWLGNVTKVIRKDGLKMLWDDDSWLLFDYLEQSQLLEFMLKDERKAVSITYMM